VGREIWSLARLYAVLLAICTVGRISLGIFNVPYEKGHHVFSLVTLSIFASIFYGAFGRRWRGLALHRVVVLTGSISLMTQIVIVTATLLSYALGASTYFNAPAPLGSAVAVPVGEAVVRRLGGLVANTILAGVIGGVGWCLGPLLPEKN
jgi:hypothetical protein